jgi:hypothetical protein
MEKKTSQIHITHIILTSGKKKRLCDILKAFNPYGFPSIREQKSHTLIEDKTSHTLIEVTAQLICLFGKV